MTERERYETWVKSQIGTIFSGGAPWTSEVYWSIWQAAVPLNAADDSMVICPNCVHQFRAIPINVQALLLAAGYEPPFTGIPCATENAVPPGYVLVPVEPTLEMVIAGENCIGRHAWAKMIAARPGASDETA